MWQSAVVMEYNLTEGVATIHTNIKKSEMVSLITISLFTSPLAYRLLPLKKYLQSLTLGYGCFLAIVSPVAHLPFVRKDCGIQRDDILLGYSLQ